jgi:hypothetical protein
MLFVHRTTIIQHPQPVASWRRVVSLWFVFLAVMLTPLASCAEQRPAKPRTVAEARAFIKPGQLVSEIDFWLTTAPVLVRGAPNKLWKVTLADGELWYTTQRTLLDRNEILASHRIVPAGTLTQDEGKLLFPDQDTPRKRPFEVTR